MKKLIIVPLKENGKKKDYVFLNSYSVKNASDDLAELIAMPFYKGIEEKKIIRLHSERIEKYENVIFNKLMYALNNLHNENHNKIYWRTMLATWIQYFIRGQYRKYLELKCVQEEKLKIVAWKINDEVYYQDNLEKAIYNTVYNGEYNAALYFKLGKLLGFEFEYLEHDQFDVYINICNKKKLAVYKKNIMDYFSNPKKKIKVFTGILLNKFFNRFSYSLLKIKNRIAYRIPYPDDFENEIITFKMFFKSHGRIVPFRVGKHEYKMPIDIRKREKLRELLSSKDDDEFISLMVVLLEECLPAMFLEQYTMIKKQVLELSRPYRIFGLTPQTTCEEFTFYAALWQERGVEFFNIQHGLDYGTILPSSGENEKKLSSKFFSWGINDPNKNIYPMPAFKHTFHERRNDNQRTTVLYASTDFGAFDIHEISFKYYEYLQNIIEFFQNLEQPIRKHIRLRLRYYDENNWQTRSRIEKKLPWVMFDKREKSIEEALESAKLLVCDNLSTCILQALANNIPIVIILDKRVVAPFISEAMEEIFLKMKAVRMAFDDPIEAAIHINEIDDNVNQWWEREDVQSVKNEFCYHFARTSKNWLDEWLKVLLNKDIQEN